MQTPIPPYPPSTYIKEVIPDEVRFHYGEGDMWPLTWASDGNLYGGAGDNNGLIGQWSPMNFWKITGHPETGPIALELVDNLPMDPRIYCQKPDVDPDNGIKPCGVLSLKGVLYFAVQTINYGDNPEFNRQHNIHAWIITSRDYGKTWDREATPETFFSGRLASPHFIQYGRDYENARDGYVYAYFPAAKEGNSYWCNDDFILLGRVPAEEILTRESWEFFAGSGSKGEPFWNADDSLAVPVFHYPGLTGDNHISYIKGIGRYLMGNYAFIDANGNPRPYHNLPLREYVTQLTLYEAPEPWGPWALIYRDDNWGNGDYQPCFPGKWASPDGKTVYMVSSGNQENYNFMVQKLTLVTY